ncbi:sensor histidine kinase [Streptomyces soliscabiei]|uniref:sensor histidine kinase n=1 Tax=Streptomyces soliscabiei TaxID=588897 RepID=UPI0029A5E40F|nr:histidine kinase [Streptomyces sp. NY05-11A]MDX2678167.1 histidine kinase [Streptomyces sp. NY05-11A]
MHARCCLAVLAPSPAEQLAARVTELTRTRADVLQAHGAELRRIERDLHDGTQARLVAIAIRLAVAGESLPQDPDAAAALVRQAQAETEEATMTELRSVICAIYPPVLADQGLVGALGTLTGRAGVPTRIDVGELGEVPAAVEAVRSEKGTRWGGRRPPASAAPARRPGPRPQRQGRCATRRSTT